MRGQGRDAAALMTIGPNHNSNTSPTPPKIDAEIRATSLEAAVVDGRLLLNVTNTYTLDCSGELGTNDFWAG